MGYLKSVGTAIIYIAFFFAIITFLPGLPPVAEFSEYRIKEPSETKFPFEIKNRLKGAEVLYSGELKGAESFASYKGELYTGISGGYVIKIDGKNIVPIVKFGKKCEGLWQEEKCGRPLGLQFNDKGELFVADAYYGIFKVDVNTGQFTNIVNSSKPIDGKPPMIVNSIDIAKNGDIYWTDSSTYFPLCDGVYTMLANPSGRLIRYNAATKKNEVLLKNLAFANGVLLADDESFVIVSETLSSRIIKYHLRGPKTGQSEIFVEALPGLPDNIHSDGQGGFLVSIITYADSEHPMLLHSLMPHPYLRKLVTRLIYLMEAPFKLLHDVYPNYYAERIVHTVGSFESSQGLDSKKMSIVLRLDKVGNILDAMSSDDGTVHNICSAYMHKGYLWLGSPWNEYIMRVPLKQTFPQLKDGKKPLNEKQQKVQEPHLTVINTPYLKDEAKPSKAKLTAQETTTTPKPTTTTPKSTTTTPKPTTATPKPTTTTPKPTTTTPKPTTTTPKPTTTTPKPTTTTPKPTTTTPKSTTTTSKPTQKAATEQKRPITTTKPSSSTPPPSKVPTKEVKKENSKEIKNENLKEVKKESPTSNVNTKTTTDSTKKSQGDKMKSKSDGSAKQNVRDTQSGKPKEFEKNGESVKK